ncbi:MAG: ribonuclease III [Myxococcales bacterium]|nr:ribonuclease III [Myxococcales bacterium]
MTIGLPSVLATLPDQGGDPAVALALGELAPLEALLGYRFARPALLRVALTLASWCNEHPGAGWPSNESLEFFGDAVLDLVAADLLWRRFPELGEGQLTRLRASVVSERALAAAARGSGLGEWLFLGRGDEQKGGRERDATLADSVEAVLGAAFLDARAAGQDPLLAAAAVFRALLGERVDRLAPDHGVDAKSRLQQWSQRVHRMTPVYLTEASPDSAPGTPLWLARVQLEIGKGTVLVLGEGEGTSMRRAQHAAAAAALVAVDRGELDELEGESGEG